MKSTPPRGNPPPRKFVMNSYSLFHLSDQALAEGLASVVSEDRRTTASLLAHIAEFDARRLYAPAGFSSMHGYCVARLHLSEDAAYKRIAAARAARDHRAVFAMLAEGRLHLTAIVRLAPHLSLLSAEDADHLLQDATGKSKSEIELLLAERFPRPDLRAAVRARPESSSSSLVPEPVAPAEVAVAPESVATPGLALVPEPVDRPGRAPSPTPASPNLPVPVSGTAAQPRIALRSPQRYGVQFTMGQATHELLRYVEDLLGHRLDSDDLERALAAGLQSMVAGSEKRRFAATSTPRKPRTPAHGRTIPADVKRKVWARDGGRCTFVSDDGRRCDARRFLEFDHIEPVGRGGRSTIENLRLRCRAHNQLEADRVFGAGFMHAVRTGNRSGDSAGCRSSAGR